MFRKLMDVYLKLGNGKIILLLLLPFLLTNFVIVPAIYPKFQMLDTLSSYTPEKTYQLISSYGEQGRRSYAVIECTLDLAYPFITALIFSLLALVTFKKAFPASRWVAYLSLLPFLIMLVDYLENACVVTMLLSYPRQLDWLARLSNAFTVVKFAMTPVELLFLVGLIGWAILAIRTR